MFLQRNTAGQVFTVPGTLRAVADGSAVTSGASLTWVKDGTSGASGGTLTHISDGAYKYAPTQSETDSKICGWVLSATGAIGLAGSVRTTAADPNDAQRLGLTVLPSTGTLAVKPAVTLAAADAPSFRTGTAQAGASTSITLDAAAAAVTDYYKGAWVVTTGGTGAGQARLITAYNGTSKIATVANAWATNPDSTTTFSVVPAAAVNLAPTQSFNNTGQTTAFPANIIEVNGDGDGAAGLDAIGLAYNEGSVNASVVAILGTALTETVTGNLAGAFKKAFDVAAAALKWTVASVIQTGDGYARLGAPAGASVSADIAAVKTDTGNLATRLTAARAGYLDNLNVGGPVASHADITTINQSASKHLLLQTVGQYERPEAGNTVYTVEARTYSAADGSAVNADTTPTLTATGQTSGSLSGNLSAASNPATGVYRWTYTVAFNATQEPIRFDVSATISSSTFTLSCYSQVVDEMSATWTTTDRSMLTSVYNNVDATISSRQPSGAVVVSGLQNGVITASSIAAAAFNGKGDWSTLSLVQLQTELTNIKTMAIQWLTMDEVIPTTSNYRFKSAALTQAPTGGGGGSGLSGPVSVTVNYFDASGSPMITPVEFTVVGQGPGRSDASGVATFGLEAGVYTLVSGQTDGVLFPTTIVDASSGSSVSVNVTGTAVVLPSPSTPTAVIGTLLCVDCEGLPESSVSVTVQIVSPPAGATGVASHGGLLTVISGSSGVVYFTGLLPGYRYKARRGSNGDWVEFDVPTDEDSFELPDMLGMES